MKYCLDEEFRKLIKLDEIDREELIKLIFRLTRIINEEYGHTDKDGMSLFTPEQVEFARAFGRSDWLYQVDTRRLNQWEYINPDTDEVRVSVLSAIGEIRQGDEEETDPRTHMGQPFERCPEEWRGQRPIEILGKTGKQANLSLSVFRRRQDDFVLTGEKEASHEG